MQVTFLLRIQEYILYGFSASICFIICLRIPTTYTYHFSKTRKKFVTSQTFSLIKEVLCQQRFFLDQGSFPQFKIFFSLREFSPSKDFSRSKLFFLKEVFPQGIFYKQRFFLDRGSFPEETIFLEAKTFLCQVSFLQPLHSYHT